LNALGVGEHVLFSDKLVVFANANSGLLNLTQLERDEILARRALPSVHPRAIQLLPGSPERLPLAGDTFDDRIEMRVAVEERKVRQRVEQGLVFVLPMELDETQRQVAKSAGCRKRAVDKRSAAPLARDLAADDQTFTIVIELGLDGGLRLARSHQIGRGSGTQQESDCLYDNRLPRAGFSCKDVEA
jgi:hypothetical protein